MKNLWDERFAGKAYVYGTEPNRFFASQIAKLKPGTILLPGEGEGRNAVFAASLGFVVDAIDFSEQARNKAMALAQTRQVHVRQYIVSDLLEATLPEACYEIAAEIFLHLPADARQLWHKKLIRSLCPGAVVIFEAYHLNQLNYRTGGPQHPDLLYNAEMLRRDFEGFNFLLLEETIDELNEGILHRGLSALVRMVAQKPW